MFVYIFGFSLYISILILFPSLGYDALNLQKV